MNHLKNELIGLKKKIKQSVAGKLKHSLLSASHSLPRIMVSTGTSNPATAAGQKKTLHIFFSLVTKESPELVSINKRKKSTERYKASHREIKMLASDSYTDLRAGTCLTAGELHHSYTNI